MILPAIAPTRDGEGLAAQIHNRKGEYLGTGFVYPDGASVVFDGQNYKTMVPVTWEWPSVASHHAA